MRWRSYRNPVYVSADGNHIDCILDVVGRGEIPFTASATDPMDYGRQLHAEIVSGSVPIGAYVPPPSPPDLTKGSEPEEVG
jgi:hypothetical protein